MRLYIECVVCTRKEKHQSCSWLLFYLSNLQAAEQEYEKEKLNERIAKLAGGVAVIQV